MYKNAQMGADGRSLHRIELCKLVRGGIRREDAVESLISSGFFGGKVCEKGLKLFKMGKEEATDVQNYPVLHRVLHIGAKI